MSNSKAKGLMKNWDNFAYPCRSVLYSTPWLCERSHQLTSDVSKNFMVRRPRGRIRRFGLSAYPYLCSRNLNVRHLLYCKYWSHSVDTVLSQFRSTPFFRTYLPRCYSPIFFCLPNCCFAVRSVRIPYRFNFWNGWTFRIRLDLRTIFWTRTERKWLFILDTKCFVTPVISWTSSNIKYSGKFLPTPN